MSIVPGRDVPAVPQEWVDAVNKAINDENHLDLCACDGWPEACRSYKPGLWDLGEASLHIAIGVLEPLIRERITAEAQAVESGAPRTEWATVQRWPSDGRENVCGPTGESLARRRASEYPAMHRALLRREVKCGPWVEVPADEVSP